MVAAEPSRDDLTPDEAAAALQVQADTIRRWLRQGRLHGTRVGSTRAGWRIPATEVERLLAGAVDAGR